MRTCFEIFYIDNSETGKTLEDWKAMPDEGILGVVERTDRTYGHPIKLAGVRHAYRDYYWMLENGEIGSGSAKQIPDNAVVKRGKYVDDETWMDVYNNKIMVDPYGP